MPHGVEILRDADAIERLIPEWNALAEADPNASPFARGDVAVGLWQVLAPHLAPRVITCRSADGVLQGVLPLAQDRRRVGPLWLRILGPLPRWHGQEFDVTIAPTAPPETLQRLLAALPAAEPGHDAVVAQHLAATTPLQGVVACTEERPTRRVTLTPDGATLPHAATKNWRRTCRRTRERFPDVQTVHTHEAHALRIWLERFVVVHRRRWAGTPTPSQFEAPGAGVRFVAWWAGLVESGVADLHLIHAGEELLAGLCTLRGNGGTYGWRLAVAPEYPNLGLGIQICQAAMAHAGARGDRWYDLGSGEEQYKSLWIGETRPLLRWRAAGPGARWTALATLSQITGRQWSMRFLMGGDQGENGTRPAPVPGSAPAVRGQPPGAEASMIVRDVVHQVTGDTTLLAGVVDAERVFWEFPTTVPSGPRGEPFVAALLPAAMATGRSIELPATLPVDATFLANIEQLQTIFTRWFPGHHRVTIRATVTPHEVRGTLRATGYSGGLDSSYTVDVLGPYLDAVVLIEGIEYRDERPGLSEAVATRLSGAMARRNLRLLRVRTNVKAFGRALGARWHVALGGALASAVHVLGLAEYHVAASNSWENLRPYGSHPVTDPLWSSGVTTLHHHGTDLRRIDKARYLGAVPDLLDELRVCFQGTDYNCGQCQKCLMTSAALRALAITTPAMPRLEDPTLLRRVYIEHDGDLVDWEEILLPDLARRDPPLHAELTRAIRRYRWRALLRTVDTLATGGRLRGLVRRTQLIP
jgi:CelD/BcsL family acetyltransferase involved in cellulose biosynthesis